MRIERLGVAVVGRDRRFLMLRNWRVFPLFVLVAASAGCVTAATSRRLSLEPHVHKRCVAPWGPAADLALGLTMVGVGLLVVKTAPPGDLLPSDEAILGMGLVVGFGGLYVPISAVMLATAGLRAGLSFRVRTARHGPAAGHRISLTAHSSAEHREFVASDT